MLTARSVRPAARSSGMQTFSTIAVPGHTWEAATCATVGCEKEANGWKVRLDESLPMGRLRAEYIRKVTARRGWTETLDPSGQVTIFTFPPGTPCFQDMRDLRGQRTFEVVPHRRQVRHALHVVSTGNATDVQRQITARGKPESLIRAHTRPKDWAEHLAESWNRMADAINK